MNLQKMLLRGEMKIKGAFIRRNREGFDLNRHGMNLKALEISFLDCFWKGFLIRLRVISEMSRYLFLSVCVLLLLGCSSGPHNRVGKPYDADSSYCRDLARNRYVVEGSRSVDIKGNEELYTMYCEPKGSWSSRDPEGYDSRMDAERSWWGQLFGY